METTEKSSLRQRLKRFSNTDLASTIACLERTVNLPILDFMPGKGTVELAIPGNDMYQPDFVLTADPAWIRCLRPIISILETGGLLTTGEELTSLTAADFFINFYDMMKYYEHDVPVPVREARPKHDNVKGSPSSSDLKPLKVNEDYTAFWEMCLQGLSLHRIIIQNKNTDNPAFLIKSARYDTFLAAADTIACEYPGDDMPDFDELLTNTVKEANAFPYMFEHTLPERIEKYTHYAFPKENATLNDIAAKFEKWVAEEWNGLLPIEYFIEYKHAIWAVFFKLIAIPMMKVSWAVKHS